MTEQNVPLDAYWNSQTVIVWALNQHMPKLC